MFYFYRNFLILIYLSINLFSNDEFYTISICSNQYYKDAVYCKDSLLKEHKYDITITKEKGNLYRTNYGIFSSKQEAIDIKESLDDNLKKYHPFILKLDNQISKFELYEIYPINQKVKNIKQKMPKVAFLTFDDGPLKATKNIIEVINEENIPITMFFIGSQINSFKTIYEEALSFSNITIANHTYSHANNRYKKFYSDPILVVEDIKSANSIISKDRVSKTSSAFLPVRLAGRNVFRLPNIQRDDNMIPFPQRETEIIGYDDIFKEGYYIYGWDLEWPYESNGKPMQTAEEIFEKMEKIYKNNSSSKENKVILLMHDFMFAQKFNGKENLQTLIQLLKDNDWSFENIENY